MVPLQMMPSTIFSIGFQLSLSIFSPVNRCERRGDSFGLSVAGLLQHPRNDHQGSFSDHLQQLCCIHVDGQVAPQNPMCFPCEINIVHSVFHFKLSIYSFSSFPFVSWVWQSYSLHFLLLSYLHMSKIGNSEVNTGRQSNCSHIRRSFLLFHTNSIGSDRNMKSIP